MIIGDDPSVPRADDPPELAALAEEITRRLERGETVDPDEYQQAHPKLAAPVRGLIAMLSTLVELGRASDPFRGPHAHAEDEEFL